MSRTVDEKVKYNKAKKDIFGLGYSLGVALYRDYGKGDSEMKRMTKNIFSDANELAKQGDRYGKGVMCGVRDAANERKARQGK